MTGPYGYGNVIRKHARNGKLVLHHETSMWSGLLLSIATGFGGGLEGCSRMYLASSHLSSSITSCRHMSEYS
jgi:hypothetical protein